MEFEGFNFNADQFISIPGLNENKEVLAVLRYSPNIVVGANKPFLAKQKKQIKSLQKQQVKLQQNELKFYETGYQEDQLSDYDFIYDNDEQDQGDTSKKQIACHLKGIDNQHWYFIGGDLYVNLDIFTDYGIRKQESYSHWNQWRPYANFQGFQDFIQLNMRTDNQAPYEFQHLINHLQSMQNQEAFKTSKMLEQYNLFVKSELNNCNKIKSLCEGHFGNLQECLTENYNKSLQKANEIISSIGKQYPYIYFIRKHNINSLRMQVSSIGFNYLLTEILCENRQRYMQSLKRNGFKEVFTNYAHYQLLNMNLLQQNEAEIQIITVDDIVIPCKIRAIHHDLTTFNLTNDISFTNYLRIYKFEIDEYQLQRVQQIRTQRPLAFEEKDEDFQYNFQKDEFIQQYYHYFQFSKKQQSNSQLSQKKKFCFETNRESDKQNQLNLQSESATVLKVNIQEENVPNQSNNQNQKEQNILNQTIKIDIQSQFPQYDLLQQQTPLLNQSSLLQSSCNTSDHQYKDIILSLAINQSILNSGSNTQLLSNLNTACLSNCDLPIQKQKQLLELQNIQFNNNHQNQFVFTNAQIIPPQQIQILSQQQLGQNNINNYHNPQNQLSSNIFDQSQLQKQIEILSQIEKLKQDTAIQLQLQELQKLQELKQQITNDLAIKTPFYQQLKQLQINSGVNQQLFSINSIQLQFIQNYEENTQLLNLLQLQIDQKNILICS
ncbi:hypothetical protein ABPG72_001825 [Tetrahymena utriculariae]